MIQYVPSLRPPATAPETGLDVDTTTGLKPVKSVQPRTLVPLVVPPHGRYSGSSEAAEEEERRHNPHEHGERRTYDRRIKHLPMLVELRSSLERRRHNQRAGDMTEHIDVKT